MAMNEKIVAKLEALDWNVSYYTENDGGRELYEIQQHSPAGEDLCFMLEGKTEEEIIESAKSLKDNFDGSEHVADLIEAKRNGLQGVPDPETLVDDARDIQEMLDDICLALYNETPVRHLRDTARELLNDDEFCEAFYNVVVNAIKTENETPKRVARDIIRSFAQDDNCDETLISLTGYSFNNLVYLTEKELGREN